MDRRKRRFQRRTVLLVVLSCAVARSVDAQDLERTLRIGAIDGPPEYTFGRIGGVALFPDGRILVVDAAERVVRIYDRTGHHLLSFGRQGNGPGEFQLPTNPVILGDAIFVYDQQLKRVVTFNRDGSHRSTDRFPLDAPSLDRLHALAKNRWIGEQSPYHVLEITEVVSGDRSRDRAGLAELLLIQGSSADTIAEYRTGAILWYDAERASVVTPYTGRGSIGGPETLWATSGDSLLILVDAVRGRIRWLDIRSESPKLVAERNLELRPRKLDLGFLAAFDKEQRAKFPFVRRTGFITPEFSPYFTSALVDAHGQVWLKRAAFDSDPRTPAAYLVVPREEATFEARLPARFSLAVVGTDVLVGVTRDELDVQYVEVFRYDGAR